MKQLIFGLIATVMFGMSSFASPDDLNDNRKPWYLALIDIDIDVAFGNNQVINGKLYPCVGSGLCYIKVNSRAAGRAVKTDLSDIKSDTPFIAVDEAGHVYIIASEKFSREEMLRPFTLTDNVEINSESLASINMLAKKANPNAVEFRGIDKGAELSPINEDGFNKLRLN